MPDAPIAGRSGAATDLAIWNDRIYVWGGRGADGRLLDDGAWYDIEDRSWTKLPQSDLGPRNRFGFDSDNLGITILGGFDASGRPLADGARLVVDGDEVRWASLPPSPLVPGSVSISGDINATFAVGPGDDPGDPPRLAVLDRDEDDRLWWDQPPSSDPRVHGEFPPPPLPAGVAYEVASTGDALLLLSYQTDGTAVASWFTGYWLGEWSDPVVVSLPGTAGCPVVDRPTTTWLRERADGGVVGLATSSPGGVGWWALPEPPPGTPIGGMLAWGPRNLVVADGLVAYDPIDERWLRLPPLPDGARTGVSAAWVKGRLYVWGGRLVSGDTSATGWVFTPELPRGTYRLPGGFRPSGDCGGVGIEGTPIMRIDRHRKRMVTVAVSGRRYPTRWPDGYVVRFRDGRGVVLGPDDRVVARDGDEIDSLGIGYCPTGREFVFG
jgi:hypothetical protein